MALVANDEAAKVAKVGKKAFNLPTPLVAPELSAILGLGLLAVCSVWRNQLDALFSQFGV